MEEFINANQIKDVFFNTPLVIQRATPLLLVFMVHLYMTKNDKHFTFILNFFYFLPFALFIDISFGKFNQEKPHITKTDPRVKKLLGSVLFFLLEHTIQGTKAMPSENLHRFGQCAFSGLLFCCLQYAPFCL